jgi:phage terminase large subunit
VTTARIELPPKLLPVFGPPRGELMFRGAYGGRGSGKSFNFAMMAAVWGYAEPLRILCARDLQISIRESFHAELRNAIASTPWLDASYDVGVDYIRSKRNGTEFFFRGLRHNIGSIKSMAQVDLTIIEEAEDIAEQSWVDLIPTVMRRPKAEMWVIWNPRQSDSATDERFRKTPPDRSQIVEMNHFDNPWFPSGLEELRANNAKTMNPSTYAHVWEGAYLDNSDAQILGGKYVVEDFEPGHDWDGPYYGMDFGFSQDPTAAVKCWIHDGCLFVEYEAGKVGLELDDTMPYLREIIPGIGSGAVRADCARPESISFLRRNGMPRCMPCAKWAGSVRDGIAHLQSYRKIIVHPRCVEVARECRLYSFKVDKERNKVTDIVIDAHNHYMDAIRYALEPLIGSGLEKSRTKQSRATPETDAWGRRIRGAESWKTA